MIKNGKLPIDSHIHVCNDPSGQARFWFLPINRVAGDAR